MIKQLFALLVSGIILSLGLTLGSSNVHALTSGNCGMAPVTDPELRCPSACPLINTGTGSYFCGYVNLSCGAVANSNDVAGGAVRCECPGFNWTTTTTGAQCCGTANGASCDSPLSPRALRCGEVVDVAQIPVVSCNCQGRGLTPMPNAPRAEACCGIINGSTCYDPELLVGVDFSEELTQNSLAQLNPLQLFGRDDSNPDELTTPGGILSRVLTFTFPIAGLILFVMLLWSGFEILSGATNSKSTEAGKERATAAIAGFVLLFVSYWLIQLVEVILGVTIF